MEISFVFPNNKRRDQLCISEDLILKCIELEEAFMLEQTTRRNDPIPTGKECARTTCMMRPFSGRFRVCAEDSVVKAAALAKLKRLVLSYVGVPRIENLLGLQSLTELRLDNNKIEAISGLGHLVHLQWLDLSFNKIKVIEGLDTLTGLVDLSLYSNEISEVKGLDSCRKLQVPC